MPVLPNGDGALKTTSNKHDTLRRVRVDAAPGELIRHDH